MNQHPKTTQTTPDFPQQSSLTFFTWNRSVVGWIWVLKRIMGVITLSSLLEQNWWLTAVFVGLREGLSAITDYATTSNPVVTTQQTTPPDGNDTSPV